MTSNKLPLAEPIGAYPGDTPNPEFDDINFPRPFKKRTPWHQSQRFRIFFITTLLCASLGLIYDFSRPAIYASSAVLLTVTPDQIGAKIVDPSLQHGLIQKNLLRARETLDVTLAKLRAKDHAKEALPNDSAEFQKMLSVAPLEASNLLKISAEGYNAEILPILLNTLIATYAQSRSEAIEKSVAETTSALQQQQVRIKNEVAGKREELEQFRANNNILSLGRDENEVYAKLKGLTEALNTALEKRVTTKAELDAIQTAAAQGKTLVAPSEERAFSNLQQRQRELQDKLTELDNKYTRDYMALHPEMKAIPEQLAAIEKTIAEKEVAGRSLALSTASRNYQAAKNAEIALQRQLDDYKQTVLTFSNSFSAHEAMKEELIQLEEHKRVILQRITDLHIEQQQKYPQIQIIEPAYASDTAVYPPYWRDAGIIAVCSLLLGLLAIWLYEFLRRTHDDNQNQAPSPNYVTILDSRLAANPEKQIPQTQLSDEARNEALSLEQSTSTLLDKPSVDTSVRELEEREIKALLAAADLPTQQLIALLLSGIRPDELETLKPESFTLPEQTSPQQIQLNTFSPRALAIPPVLQELLAKTQGAPQWLDTDEETDDTYFNAMLSCAAIDAGLTEPSSIDSTCLQQSYIYFLVRSGIKLSELGSIAGKLSPLQLTQYGQLSPSGPGLAADEIETIHPALKKIQSIKKRTQYH